MKVLVFGATGLAGQAMVKTATSRGYSIAAAARRGAASSVDIADERAVLAFLAAEEPDVVVNCAAMTDVGACELDPWAGWSVNARALSFLASWSKATGKQLVHVSTDHYFPNGGATPHDEDAEVEFVNEYARQKFAGEAFALTAPKALVLRTSIVGIRGWERSTFAEWAIDVVENDKPALLFSDAYTSSIDVATFATATFELAERGASGVFNLAAREVYSKEEFVRELARQLARPLTSAQTGSASSLTAPRAHCLGLDVSRAEALLAYRLPRLHDVVRSVICQHKEAAS